MNKQSAWWWYLVFIAPLVYLTGAFGSDFDFSYILNAAVLYFVGYAIGAGRRTAWQQEITARQIAHEKTMRDKWEALAMEIRRRTRA